MHRGGREFRPFFRRDEMRMEQITVRILNKLFAQGYVSERQIADLTVTEILALPGISIAEIEKITQLQKAVKQRYGWNRRSLISKRSGKRGKKR